ncbi:MAG: isoprenylcysteine carboxylmethyltransferase family protein [Planctomycetota bacterium]|nr:isoprenylcysteine carboxylmethyltransferase family protein [Planctomycetota bacterium]
MTSSRFLLICLAFYPLLVGEVWGLAGTLDPLAWATLAVTCVFHLVCVLLCAHDIGLIRERLRPGPGAPRWDLLFMRFTKGCILVSVVVVPLDIGRFHWSMEIAGAWRIAGLVGIAIGLVLIGWTMRTNTFFSSVVRLQEERGHHLIQEGPYRLVRHPGYLGVILFFTGFNLGLGCLSGITFAAGIGILLIYRIVREERFLHEHLDGYSDYAQRICWRLIPRIW